MDSTKTLKNKKSLRRMAFFAILLDAFILLFLSIIVEAVLFVFPSLQNYKREMRHESAFALKLINASYIEDFFSEVKKSYYSIPDEFANNCFSDEYKGYFDYYDLIDENFIKARNILKSCREKSEMSNFYLSFYDEKHDRLVYVIDGNEDANAFLPGQWISNETGEVDSISTINRVFASDWYMPVTYGKAYGFEATDYEGIYDEAGNLIGYMSVNVSINAIVNQIVVFLAVYIPVMLVLLLAMAFYIAKAMDKRVLLPVKKLSDAADKYTEMSSGNSLVQTHIFKDLNITTNDEIEDLWKTVVNMEDAVFAALRQIKEVTAKQERIATELDLAKNIQLAALPKKLITNDLKEKIDIYAEMTPAKEVGGDFYDYFMIDENHLAIVIADVSGKGVPAALFMMISKMLIKHTALNGGNPSKILMTVNNRLCEENSLDMFVTVWLGILNISTGEVIAASAGHEYPFITNAEGNYELLKDPHGLVLGVMENMIYEDYNFTLQKNGKLFVYTDGVAEAQNEKEEMFGLDRLKNSLNLHKVFNAEELVDIIKRDINIFSSKTDQFDDITMLNLWYKG